MIKYKEIALLVFLFSLLLSINLGLKYSQYKDFKSSDIYKTKSFVLAIYDDNKTIKLKNNDFIFYTYLKNHKLEYLDTLEITVITKNITFIDYLRGFWATTIISHKQNLKYDNFLFELTKK